MAEEKKEAGNIDPKIQAFVDCLYPANLKLQSSKAVAAHCTSLFHENIDWMSTSYHTKKSELIQKAGKKECTDYFLEIFSPNNVVGFKNKIQKMDINGLKGTVFVSVELIDDKNQSIGDKMSMEESFELNKDGLCTRLISVSQDYDIIKLTKKQYLFKSIKDNDDKTKAIITCLDEDFNKIKFEMNTKEEQDKLTQINRIVKEGEIKKKDVMIVIVEPQTKTGQITTIVSHAVVC
eukprot:429692_1